MTCKTILSKFYYHIDNGGISLEISKDKTDFIEISLETCYHGHPSVLSKLSGDIGPKELESMAKVFLEAAEELRK